MAKWTTSGNARISTTQSKFGGSSLGLASSTGIMTTNSYRNSTLTDFTFEGFFYFGAFGNNNVLFATNIGSSFLADNSLCLYTSSTQAFLFMANAVQGGFTVNHGMSINTWYHLALVRSGTSVYFFRDGTLLRTFTQSSTVSSARISVGMDSNSSAGMFGINGYVDEVRITAAARYTSAFSAPTSAFTLVGDGMASSTISLLHFDGTNGSSALDDDVVHSYYSGSSNNYVTAYNLTQLGPAWSLAPNQGVINPGDMKRMRRINPAMGDSTMSSILDSSRTSNFISGIAVKDGVPLPKTKIILRAKGESWVDGYETGSDGSFIFHELGNISQFYRATATPPDSIDHNEIVWSRLTAVPYDISTTGNFSQNTTTSLVDGEVTISSGLEPFTVELVHGSLPPSTTLNVNGRTITIDGVTTFTGSYIFTLQISNDFGKSTTREFELTPPGVNSMGSIKAYTGETMKEDRTVWKYWRLRLSEPHVSTNYVGFAEVVMTDVLGGASITTGGTPFASSTFSGYPVSRLFDGLTNADWYTANQINPATTNEWCGYEFAVPTKISQFRLHPTITTPNSYFPKYFIVQGSADGITWENLKTFTTSPAALGVWQTFDM